MPVTSDAQAWMRLALLEAESAHAIGEVPIGCIVVHDPTGAVVGRGHNRRQTDHDPTAHAEIIAMRRAGQTIGHWRLLDCTLYVTLEPCPMCAGAMVNARVPRLVYGCDDPKAGAVRSLFQLCDDTRLNHRLDIQGGVLADECTRCCASSFANNDGSGKNDGRTLARG